MHSFGYALFYLGGSKTKIKLELLREYVTDFVCQRLEDFDVDVNQVAESTAIRVLGEIQKVIQNEAYSDVDMDEEIVCIFETYKLDAGPCHDF